MPRTTSVFVIVIAVIALTLLAAPAGANVTTYTNSIAWSGATSNIFTIDFNGSAGAESTDYSTEGGLTISGVQIVGHTGETGVYNLTAFNPAGMIGDWGSGDYLAGGYSPSYLLVTLPGSGSTAVGFNLLSFPAAKSVLVTVGSESYTAPTFTKPTLAFWGIVSDTPITSVRLSTTGGYTGLDNFVYSGSDDPAPPDPEVPEAQTFFLGGSGIALLWLARRMRRRC